MRALEWTIQAGQGDYFIYGKVGKRVGVSRISVGGGSQATRVAKVKTIWKRRTDHCNTSDWRHPLERSQVIKEEGSKRIQEVAQVSWEIQSKCRSKKWRNRVHDASSFLKNFWKQIISWTPQTIFKWNSSTTILTYPGVTLHFEHISKFHHIIWSRNRNKSQQHKYHKPYLRISTSSKWT